MRHTQNRWLAYTHYPTYSKQPANHLFVASIPPSFLGSSFHPPILPIAAETAWNLLFVCSLFVCSLCIPLLCVSVLLLCMSECLCFGVCEGCVCCSSESGVVRERVDLVDEWMLEFDAYNQNKHTQPTKYTHHNQKRNTHKHDTNQEWTLITGTQNTKHNNTTTTKPTFLVCVIELR